MNHTSGAIKEIVVISGKGGTGKTTLTASFALLGRPCVLVDCDVDAADLFLVMKPERLRSEKFEAGKEPVFDREACTSCGRCVELCRFEALEMRDGVLVYDRFSCEGCALCSRVCPAGAITMKAKECGEWYISDTPCGPMAHARLYIAEENSGKLVTVIREQAKRLAQEKGIDTIFIDGTPGIGCPVISSMTGVHYAVVVTEPTLSGLHDLKRIVELTRQFNIKTAVCVNKYDLNEEMAGNIEEYCRSINVDLLGHIPYDRTVIEYLARGESVVNSPESSAAKAMRDIREKLQEGIK